MQATSSQAFQLMRFNVLSHLGGHDLDNDGNDGYFHAWQASVYPLHHEGWDWHKPFAAEFDVSEEQVGELGDYLDSLWLAKNPPSFYQIENHYGVAGSTGKSNGWDRTMLLRTCRYLFLTRLFDATFWQAVTENGKCPAEAHSITNL